MASNFWKISACIQSASAVTQSCPTLCDPMDCSAPGFPVYHQLPELTQTHTIQSALPSSHLILCHPLLLPPSIFPSMGVFSNVQLFLSGGQSIGVSASASVLPMNIQNWFPLGRTGWISLQSKGLLRIFSNTTKHQFSALSFLYCPTLTFIHDYWKNHSLTRRTFVSKVMSLLFNMLSSWSEFFFQIASTFWFHGCSHHLQWFWRPAQNKVSHCFHCFPIYLPWSDGTGYHIIFLNVEF